MRRHMPLLVTLLSLACDSEPTSPTGPRATLEPAVNPTFTMRGEVTDTTNLPVSGAQVQVVAPSRGPVAVTDESGQFALSWPSAGVVTVRVSKEGFHARERVVPERGATRYPLHLGFELEAIDAPVIVAGVYEMTFTAANECVQLPTVARKRVYRAQVYPNGVGRFSAMVFDIEPSRHTVFHSEVRGEPPPILRVVVVTEPDVSPAIGIVEQIERDLFFEVTGSAELPLGGQSAAVAFDGTFALCPAHTAVSYETPYRCPVQPRTCRSVNHRLAWLRQ